MYEVKVQDSFSAAHWLREYEGDCEALHGHNWRVEIGLERKELTEDGFVADFRKLKTSLKEVLSSLDHACLNELKYFSVVNPTSENIAKFIFDELGKHCPYSDILREVCVWESDTCCAIYRKD